MPVYNGEVGIKQALKSLLNQSYKNLRLVIHDNASTDQTREICKHFAQLDDRVSLRINEYNIGAAANFTQGKAPADFRH
jgi:glycosyltransferase involved in cell wall biosynthesis